MFRRHSSPNTSLIAIMAAALALTACAYSGTSVSRVEVAETYEPTEAGFLGGEDRSMPTVIWHGPGAEAEAPWLAAFSRYRPGAPLTFTAATAADGAQARHRVMILFTPPTRLADAGLCRLAEAPAPAAKSPGQGTAWRVAYCVGDRTRSEASGMLSSGPDGSLPQAFGALAPELALRLFPVVNPHRRGERCLPPRC